MLLAGSASSAGYYDVSQHLGFAEGTAQGPLQAHKAGVRHVRSRLTASLQAQNHQSKATSINTGERELFEILQNNSASEGATTLFGVSPPVRTGCYGGAANPIMNDSSWKQKAYSASRTNLQVLRDLDSTGMGFLCGNQLLVGSPMSLSSEGSWCERAGMAMASHGLSSAGSVPRQQQPFSGVPGSIPFTSCRSQFNLKQQ